MISEKLSAKKSVQKMNQRLSEFSWAKSLPLRLQKQLRFIAELEKLKMISRRNLLVDQSRPENSAEHSWNVALMVLVLREHANAPDLDFFRVVQMLLIHDIVEIDGGDTWLYDEVANQGKQELEENCAQRIYGLLPNDQKQEMIDLWHEFEKAETKEAQFAASLDSLHPLLNHLWSGGGLIEEDQLSEQLVRSKKQHIAKGSEELWKCAQSAIGECSERGLFAKE